ncbi:MAG: LysR family transcriptional regulator [Proteobacteria bacterium]|nr:LysR family transcriptional regulator [Pseudomonadota bacterium]
MDWDKLRVFHVVAETGSFTHAGEALNLSQSAVSRQISGLEGSLDVPLFHRHARGLVLTEQGERLYRSVHEIYAKLAMTEAQIRESKKSPKGPLRITTTIAFGSVWLTSHMAEFLSLYPDIDVSMVLNDSDLDLSMGEADVAVRMTPPTQPDLVQRRLMTLQFHVFASSEYIKKHGMPLSPADLDKHRIVVYGEDARPPVDDLDWLLRAGATPGKPRRAILKVNNIYGIYRVVRSGLGIGAIPDYLSRHAPNLMEVLPELRGPTYDAYFVYPEALRDSKRIAVFRDFLLRKIAEDRL